MVEYWLWTLRGSNFPYLSEKPPHPPRTDILSSLCSCDIILSSSFLQCQRSSFPPSPLLALPFPFNLNCWGFSRIDSIHFSVKNETRNITTTNTWYEPLSYATFSSFLIYIAKANNVPSASSCVYSTEEETETQRNSTTYPPWVSRLLMDRARQSSTIPAAHDHFSIPVVLTGVILHLRGQLEISGDMLVVTAGAYYWHLVYRNLLNILQCTGWVWREKMVPFFPSRFFG